MGTRTQVEQVRTRMPVIRDAGGTYRREGRKLRNFIPGQFYIIHPYLNENTISFHPRNYY